MLHEFHASLNCVSNEANCMGKLVKTKQRKAPNLFWSRLLFFMIQTGNHSAKKNCKKYCALITGNTQCLCFSTWNQEISKQK